MGETKEKRKWILGIDEAGRGSLVGEMMVAGYAISNEKVSILDDIGVKDSKELTPGTRERIYIKLIEISNVFVVYPVRPKEIDRENLNRLTERAAEKIIFIIAKRLGDLNKIAAIYIDRFGRLRELPKLLRRQGFSGLLVIEERADSKYKIVGAASIIAKYIRDKRIKILSALYGVKGSGYPSDPLTASWVKEKIRAGNFLPIIRYSWSTLKEFGFGRKLGQKKTLLDFMGEENNG